MNCGICDALGGCNCQSKEDGSGFDDFVELGETIYGYSPEYYESYCEESSDYDEAERYYHDYESDLMIAGCF